MPGKARLAPAPIDTKFGEWTVIGDAGRNQYGGTLLQVRCSCGVERNVLQGNLRLGMSRSCGGPAHKKTWVVR